MLHFLSTYIDEVISACLSVTVNKQYTVIYVTLHTFIQPVV